MITNKELLRLMERISDTTATEEDIRIYNTWCNTFRGKETDVPGLDQIQADMLVHIHQFIGKKSLKIRWSVQRIAAAAVILITFSAAVYFFAARFTATRYLGERQDLYTKAIEPGKNKATLTFANGKVISLSDARTGVIVNGAGLKYNDGTDIASLRPTPRIEMLTAATPRGGTYGITLPDGTKVWLNAASSIKFPASFANAAERKVELLGEAYFEVAKDKRHAFIVATPKQQVEVLGTHFNINSYADEETTKTSLLEGSIHIKSAEGDAILKPGEQAVTTVKGIMLVKGDAEEAIAWKNGLFRFNEEGIEQIMRKISRWYNIEVVYQGQITKEGFTGKISRNNSISEVLMMLEQAKGVHFKIEGRRVIVTQ